MAGRDRGRYPAEVIGTRAAFLFTAPRLETGERSPRA